MPCIQVVKIVSFKYISDVTACGRRLSCLVFSFDSQISVFRFRCHADAEQPHACTHLSFFLLMQGYCGSNCAHFSLPQLAYLCPCYRIRILRQLECNNIAPPWTSSHYSLKGISNLTEVDVLPLLLYRRILSMYACRCGAIGPACICCCVCPSFSFTTTPSACGRISKV